MDVRLYLRVTLCSGLLLASCGENDGGPQAPIDDVGDSDDGNEERAPGSQRDAGTRKDAGKDARAPSRDDAEGEDEGDESEAPRDDSRPDARADAGAGPVTTRDSGATNPRDEPEAGNDDPTQLICGMISYANFGKRFIDTYCVGCHGASGPQQPALNTLARVVANKDLILERVIDPVGVQPMPPMGFPTRPTDEDKGQLGIWLSCDPPR